MPSPATLADFAAAAFVLIAVPGPNLIQLVARSVSEGRRAGLLSALGIETGTLVHTAAAAVGLSALPASSAPAFALVKYAGGAYLVYLGLRALLARESGAHAAAPADPGRIGRPVSGCDRCPSAPPSDVVAATASRPARCRAPGSREAPSSCSGCC